MISGSRRGQMRDCNRERNVYMGFGKRTEGQREIERDRGSEREGTDRQRGRSPQLSYPSPESFQMKREATFRIRQGQSPVSEARTAGLEGQLGQCLLGTGTFSACF